LPADLLSRVRQPQSEPTPMPAGGADVPMSSSPAHFYGQPGTELLNSYLDPTGMHQSFKSPSVGGGFPVAVPRWDGYPEDDDYLSDDGNSDRELSGFSKQPPLPSSHLLAPPCSQSPMFSASRPYLCSSSVIDRMCATFGQQANTPMSDPHQFDAHRDALVVDHRTGGNGIQSQPAEQSVYHPAGLNPFVNANPVTNECVLFDGEVERLAAASDDDPFRDTESQSPVIEEDSWQCIVEEGEVELT